MAMKNEGRYNTYKNLLYAVITLFAGISILINPENKHFYGWLILSLSFGFLASFIEQRINNQKLKFLLIILSYAVPVTVIILGIIIKLLCHGIY